VGAGSSWGEGELAATERWEWRWYLKVRGHGVRGWEKLDGSYVGLSMLLCLNEKGSLAEI
jgi:hypothetical protein